MIKPYLILSIILLLLSCSDNENTDINDLRIIVEAKIEKNDDFRLYFKKANENFELERTFKTQLFKQEGFQKFKFKAKGLSTFLKFEFGIKNSTDSIVIKSIEFRYKDKSVLIDKNIQKYLQPVNWALLVNESPLTYKKTELNKTNRGVFLFVNKDFSEYLNSELGNITIKEENKTNYNPFSIEFNLNLKQKDELRVYYLVDKNSSYNAKKSVARIVTPSVENQTVNFEIDVSLDIPTNLRFDYATVKNQEVIINEIVIKKGNSKITIHQNEISEYFFSPKEWNVNINLDKARFGTKKYKGRFDSKLVGTKKLETLLKKFKDD